MPSPAVVDFPLRGAWITPNTPGTRIPSHGSDLFGETYAYDFVGIDPYSRSPRFYRPSPLHYLVFGVRLEDCYGWGQPIFSATAGTVVQIENGWPERNPVHLARDIPIMMKNARAFGAKETAGPRPQDHPNLDFRTLAGNYITVESPEGYVVYAHAQTGSVCVSPGDRVIPGQHLANVGHSGNSTGPHLHFQLMDHPDPWKAQGLPCCFREYEVFEDGAWRKVQNGIPRATDRIRKR